MLLATPQTMGRRHGCHLGARLEGITQAFTHQLSAAIEFDRREQLRAAQLVVHAGFHGLQLARVAADFKGDQASLLEAGQIHIHCFGNLQLLAQARHQAAASTFSKQRCREVRTDHPVLVCS